MKKLYFFLILFSISLISFGQQLNQKKLPYASYQEGVQTNSLKAAGIPGKVPQMKQPNGTGYQIDALFAETGQKNNSTNPDAKDFYSTYKTASVPGLKSAGTGGKALVYIDYAFENDGVVDGLENLGYTVTFASDWADFNTQLASGTFELAAAMKQDYAGSSFDITTAQNFIASGGNMIFATWEQDVAEAALFEASFTGNENCTEVSISDPGLANGITNPLTISSEFWGIFSLGLEPIGSGEVLATFSDCSGDAAIIRGNGGQTIMLGYLSDSPPFGERQNLFENVINSITNNDIIVDNDPGICGAVVNYPIPTADGATVTQIDDSGLTSGDEFPVGTTVQQYELDFGGGIIDTYTFNVTVNDTEAPVAVCKGSGTGSAAYVISTGGQPWEVNTNEEAMDMVFGSGNWDQLYYETLDAGTLFSNAYDFIFMEGGDKIANEMEAFVDANISAMETWVANGGHLFLNAAPIEGDGMYWGFWGVELVYNGGIYYTNIAEATNPAHPIFSGPFTPVITGPYQGNLFAHAIIPEELNVTVLMHNVNDPDQYVLSYAEWGSGKVLFGGMTTTNFHSPQPEATNLRANMIDFLSQKMPEFQLDETGTVTITPGDIDGGSTDNCGIASMELSRTEFTRDDIGTHEVTLTVTDMSGNSSTCTTTVKITGDEEPVVVANPIDVYLDETGRYVLTREDLDEMAAGTTDDSTPFEELKLSAYPRIYTCSQLNDEIIHARLTVEDAEGNIARAWTTVMVHDTFPPAFVPVENIEIVLEPGLAESAIDYPVIEVLDNCPLVPELIEGMGADGIFPVGTTTETWVAVDGRGNRDTLSFTVTLIATNDLPTIDPIADVTVDEDDSPVTVELTGISYGNDLEEQTLTLTAESDNAGLVSAITVNYTSGSTGSLEIDLAPDAHGTALITVSVEDSEGGMVYETFTLTVVSVNDAPYLVNPIGDQTVNASFVLEVPVSPELGELFDDADGDELTISAMLEGGDPLPAWAELINDLLVFSPMIEDTGCVNIVIMATDPEGATATDTFQLCVEGYPVSAGDIASSEFNVNLYPNPARDVVNLEIKSSSYAPVDLSVYTITGRLVLRKNFSNNQLVTFSMADHVSGLYFVKLQMDGKLAVKKLVLDRK